MNRVKLFVRPNNETRTLPPWVMLRFLEQAGEGFIATHFVSLFDSKCRIDLIPDPQVPACCPLCQRSCSLIHDTTVCRIRDRDLFEYRVWLVVPVRRGRCRAGSTVLA